MLPLLLLFIVFPSTGGHLVELLAETPAGSVSPPLVRPLAYDLQIQLPLSEITDPDTPLFTAHVVMQFQLSADVGLPSPFVSDATDKGAKISFAIDGLDHFENVSIVFNGSEISITNVILTDTLMEVTVGQPILFAGRYTLSVGRYKGFIGSAIYYRDAGQHAVFGSSLFPSRASAVFPTLLPTSNQVTLSVTVVHPRGTKALSSAPLDSVGVIDDNWQMSSFRPTIPIPPSLLSFALLPSEFNQVDNSYTGITTTVHFNRFRVRDVHAKQILNIATQVIGLLKQLFSGSVAMPKVDIVLLNDIQPTPSFGTFCLPENIIDKMDYPHQVHLLANQLARHWIGGLVTVSTESEICMIEDLANYLAFKVTKRMTSDDYLRLSHYLKVVLTEEVLQPGSSLWLKEPVNENDVAAHCGLRGVIMLESLDSLIGERNMLTAINQVVFHSNPASIDLTTFVSRINQTVDSGVGLRKVFLFWRQHGGFPSLDVDKFNTSIQLRQRLSGETVQNGAGGWEKMPLWPLPLEFTEFKLPVQLMLSQGIHLAPVREGTALANLGFSHFYRVNYDLDTWQAVLEMLTQNATFYTARERAQLTSDFCNFYAQGKGWKLTQSIARFSGVLEEPKASELREEWLRMIQMRAASFPACEAAAFRCVAPQKMRKVEGERVKQLRKRIFDSLTSSEEMTCGRGAVHDAINDLCTELFGKSCF